MFARCPSSSRSNPQLFSYAVQYGDSEFPVGDRNGAIAATVNGIMAGEAIPNRASEMSRDAIIRGNSHDTWEVINFERAKMVGLRPNNVRSIFARYLNRAAASSRGIIMPKGKEGISKRARVCFEAPTSPIRDRPVPRKSGLSRKPVSGFP